MIGHTVVACEGKGTGEQTLLRGLLPVLQPGDILLADALLATWWVIAEARATGVDVVMPQHGRRLTDFSRGESLGKRDHLAVWCRPQRPGWMSVEAYKRYPVEMVMRECEVDGRVLVTTLLDPAFVSPRELDDLYSLRWTIEVDWRTIKATMEMDVLRCCSPAMWSARRSLCVFSLTTLYAGPWQRPRRWLTFSRGFLVSPVPNASSWLSPSNCAARLDNG